MGEVLPGVDVEEEELENGSLEYAIVAHARADD